MPSLQKLPLLQAVREAGPHVWSVQSEEEASGMSITASHIAKLERQYDDVWICLTLLGDPVLLTHKPQTVCYSIIAFYKKQEWFESEGLSISRNRVREIVNGCIGAHA